MSNVTDGRELLDAVLGADFTAAPAATHAPTLHFTMKKYLFQLLLERAATVVPTRDVMPVLKNFQFDARPERLRIVATDMELSMISTTELVTVEAPGTVVVPAERLLRIVREAQEGDVDFRVAGLVARITIGRTTWTLKLQDGDDYPRLPNITDAVLAPVDRQHFAAALRAVRYAACRDVNRPSLAMIDVRDGRLTACDGSRFQQAVMGEFPFDFQLPIGAVDHLCKLLGKIDTPEIGIGGSNNHLIFRLGADAFIVNRLTAQFPDMEATLLRPALVNRHPLTVDRGELLAALKRVRINADPNTFAVALRLSRGTMLVSARDVASNEASEGIEAGWDGPDRVIVLNHQFLVEMIGRHPNPQLRFTLGEDSKTRKSPVLLRDAESGTVGVVQQMRADWVGAT